MTDRRQLVTPQVFAQCSCVGACDRCPRHVGSGWKQTEQSRGFRHPLHLPTGALQVKPTRSIFDTKMADTVEFVMEMHDYQEEYLAAKAAVHGLSDSGSAFRALLTSASTDSSKWGSIFRTVHCLRCDNLPDNLSTADNAWKKSKKPVSFGLHPNHEAFLEARVANEEGAEIAEKGPVNRAVLDTSKAARTLIDWAIEQEEAGDSLEAVFQDPVCNALSHDKIACYCQHAQ